MQLYVEERVIVSEADSIKKKTTVCNDLLKLNMNQNTEQNHICIQKI